MEVPVKPEPSAAAKRNMRLAELFRQRMEAQGIKGKKRDNAAIEFMAGALAAAYAISGDDKDPNVQGIGTLAFLVSCRGSAELMNYGGQS